MPLTRKNYRQIVKDILTQITGGETTEEHKYVTDKTLYKLSNSPTTEINEVTGVSKGAPKSFVKDVDYRLSRDSVEWVAGGEHPDSNTRFTVNYTFARSSGISDDNPGSVVRTIVEAVSREIEYLYAQMDHAYLSGFLDTAEGEALDMVVSLLGVNRKPAQPSSGNVTFGRNTEPETLSATDQVVFDGSVEYDLKKAPIKEIVKIEGVVGESKFTFKGDADYILAGMTVRWLPEGNTPDIGTVFHVEYTYYQRITIPKGTVVATFSPRPEESRSYHTIEETSLEPTLEGRWEVEAPVTCTVAGKKGNVLAGSITVMSQPVPGVEYVVNRRDLANGVEAEGDSELRERAKHALEFAGKATISSLGSAIWAVEGVSSLLIEDMPDEVAGIVRVIVDGGDEKEIAEVIEETRAAGIKVEFSRPRRVYIDVSLTLVVTQETSHEEAVAEVTKILRSYISSLGIGHDVLYSKIIEAALSVQGVLDVVDVLLTAESEDTEYESERENILIDIDERAEPRDMNVVPPEW